MERSLNLSKLAVAWAVVTRAGGPQAMLERFEVSASTALEALSADGAGYTVRVPWVRLRNTNRFDELVLAPLAP